MHDEFDYCQPAELHRLLTDTLRGHSASVETVETLLDQLLRFGEREGENDTRPPSSREFVSKNHRIAIRNEYLNPLVDMATGASSAGIANLFAVLTSMHLAGIGMMLAGISAWARLRHRVVTLTERQVQVLLALRSVEHGLSEAALTKRLSELYDRAAMGRRRKAWGIAETLSALQSLQETRDRGGELNPLVKLEGKRWKLNGV